MADSESLVRQALSALDAEVRALTGVLDVAELRGDEQELRGGMQEALSELRPHIPTTAVQTVVHRGAASPIQAQLMACPGPLFIEGRSGTGKTTVVCGRIVNSYEKAKASAGAARARQLFVTRSSLLRDEVRRVVQESGVRCQAHGDDQSSTLLLTWDELLAYICRESGVGVGQLPTTITFNEFKSRIFPSLKHVSHFGPHMLWAEFLSRLSGAGQKRREYEAQARGVSATGICMVPEDFKAAFAAFEAYEKYKTLHRLHDDADIANILADKLRSSGLHFDEILVDEVQDFTPGQCRLLLRLCKSPDGICFVGDTAQTITNGCGFTFEYLRSLVSTRFSGVEPPEAVHLGRNFRSTMGIVKLSEAQVKLLEDFFPGTVDPIPAQPHYKASGARPLLVECLPTNCVSSMQGSRANARLDPSHFLVIVRTHQKREELRAAGLHATILTVEEAKGLERDVVIVVDFFKDCPLPHAGLLWNFPRAALPLESNAGYRAAAETGESRIGWLLRNQTSETLLSKKDRREVYKLAPAVLEMKHLYVADSRAAGQLVHVETDLRLMQHMLKYYDQAGGLVEAVQGNTMVGAGIPAHPTVEPHTQVWNGAFLPHAFDVASKSLELFRHAADDAHRAAVFDEAARGMHDAEQELQQVLTAGKWGMCPRIKVEALLEAVGAMRSLARGHFLARYSKSHEEAATQYIAVRLPSLAGEEYEALGDHLRAAKCFMLTEKVRTVHNLSIAGQHGLSLAVVYSVYGAAKALLESASRLDGPEHLDLTDDHLLSLAVVHQSLLTDAGAAWLVQDGRSRCDTLLERWFRCVLYNDRLQPWSTSVLQWMPPIASAAFGQAVTSLLSHEARTCRILGHCDEASAIVEPQLVINGIFKAVVPPEVPLLVLARVLPRTEAYASVAVSAALSALEVASTSRLLAGEENDISAPMGKCHEWCRSRLPFLLESPRQVDATNCWPLARTVLAYKSEQQYSKISADDNWDKKDDVISLEECLNEDLEPLIEEVARKASDVKLLNEQFESGRGHLKEVDEQLEDWLNGIRDGLLTIGGEWVKERLAAFTAGEVCLGTPELVDKVRGILDGRALAKQFYRFVPTDLREGAVPGDFGAHLTELIFFRQGQQLPCEHAAPSSIASSGEKAYVVKFKSPVFVDSYTFKTAKDAPQNDPIGWRLEGSTDGKDYETLQHVLIEGEEVTRARGAEVRRRGKGVRRFDPHSHRIWQHLEAALGSPARKEPLAKHTLLAIIPLGSPYPVAMEEATKECEKELHKKPRHISGFPVQALLTSAAESIDDEALKDLKDLKTLFAGTVNKLEKPEDFKRFMSICKIKRCVDEQKGHKLEVVFGPDGSELKGKLAYFFEKVAQAKIKEYRRVFGLVDLLEFEPSFKVWNDKSVLPTVGAMVRTVCAIIPRTQLAIADTLWRKHCQSMSTQLRAIWRSPVVQRDASKSVATEALVEALSFGVKIDAKEEVPVLNPLLWMALHPDLLPSRRWTVKGQGRLQELLPRCFDWPGGRRQNQQ